MILCDICVLPQTTAISFRIPRDPPATIGKKRPSFCCCFSLALGRDEIAGTLFSTALLYCTYESLGTALIGKYGGVVLYHFVTIQQYSLHYSQSSTVAGVSPFPKLLVIIRRRVYSTYIYIFSNVSTLVDTHPSCVFYLFYIYIEPYIAVALLSLSLSLLHGWVARLRHVLFSSCPCLCVSEGRTRRIRSTATGQRLV